MADLSLLNPAILRGVIEQFTTPDSLTLLNTVPRRAVNRETVEWTVRRGSRNVAQPNTPNSEAHIVGISGGTRLAAALAYFREKKVFEPTTLQWLRDLETDNSATTRANAEGAVLREIEELNSRFDNRAEWMLWQALTGRLVFDQKTGYGSAVNSVTDYAYRPSHVLDRFGASLATATPDQIVANVRSIRTLIEQDGAVPLTDALVSQKVMDAITDSFTKSSSNLMSDRMRDQYFSTGTIEGFLGLNWKVQNGVFDATDSSYGETPTTPSQETRFLAENAIIFGNLSANRAIELVEGPSSDNEAPRGYTGKFSKTWEEKDPSARQVLLEWKVLPVITAPDQFVYVKDAFAA